MWATTYKLTAVTSVSAGNKYVFVQNSRALSNSVSSSALQTTTYATATLAGTEAYVWALESTTDGFYLKNASLSSNQYLNNTSGTGVSFGSKNSVWTIAFTDGKALISNKSNNNRFLGDVGQSTPNNTYKAYATSNLTSYPHDFTVYILEEETTGSDPEALLSVTSLAFGRVNIGAPKAMTFTVTPANLTGDLSIASNNAKYTVSPTSIAQATTDETTITVTASPTATTDDMAGTITISGGGIAAGKTVSLSCIVRPAGANNGTAAKPYTVAEAIELIDEVGPSSDKEGIYVSGIISQIDNVNTTDGWATYWISDDGTTTTQLEAYKGKYLENVAFTSDDQIEVSDKVVIVGDLTKYNSTYEFGAGNYLTALTKDTRDYADISFANAEVLKMDTDGSYTQTATVSQADYDGTISYAITSSTSTGATINATTGAVSFSKTGSITVTATASETTNYKAKAASYTLKIKTKPTIVVADDNVAFGSTFTVDDSMIEGGAITVTSGNTAIATISGLKITPVAVGSVTITVATAADETYVAGSETFVLTVNAPTGSTTKPSMSYSTVFKNKDLEYDEGIDWTASKDANSFESSGDTPRGVQFGAAIGTFTLSTDKVSGKISKVSMVVSTNGTGNTISVSVGGTTFKCSDAESITLTSGDKNVTKEFVGIGSGTVVISVNDENKSVYFKSITVEKDASVPVTIAASKYGTYCSQYPLIIPADNENYKAYIVTAVEGSTVTFTPLSGEIKGGVPFILYGTAGTYYVPMADESDVIPAGNMLRGFLAPTAIKTVEGDYTNFGLSGGSFVKVNNGIVPANKAILPILTTNVPSTARELAIIFDDATGIDNVTREALKNGKIYNLQGQEVKNATKGIFIVNGKKVIMK